MIDWARRKAFRVAYLYALGGYSVWYGATQGW